MTGYISLSLRKQKKTESSAQALKHLPAREWAKAFQASQHLSRDEVIDLSKRELEKSQSSYND